MEFESQTGSIRHFDGMAQQCKTGHIGRSRDSHSPTRKCCPLMHLYPVLLAYSLWGNGLGLRTARALYGRHMQRTTPAKAG